MHEFIDHDKREYDLCSIAPCLPFNVLANIKAISIPTSPFKDRFFFLISLKTVYLHLNMQLGQSESFQVI